MPTLEDIQKQINEFLPKEVGVSSITAEGPKIVLTTDRLDVFVDHSDIVKDLARAIKKRIIIRPTASQLLDEAEADPMIRKIAGEESGITDIMFNPYQKEVMIEAAKLGNVIGQNGENIRKIIKATGWTPMLERATPLKSNILSSLRKTLWDKKVCRKRKEFLEDLGRKIYSKPDHTCDWIRVTPLGGAAEVGRSCFIVQTPNSNVLLDCGINVAASDPKRMFPDFRAMQLTIDDLDAIILSHAHLDHCLPPYTPVLTESGYKKIDEVQVGEKVIAMNWNSGKYEAVACLGKTRTFDHKRILTIKTPYSSIEASPNHRFFTVQGLRVKELEASELQKGMLLPSNILNKGDSLGAEVNLDTDIAYDPRRRDNTMLPKTLTEELSEFIGYYIGDGHKSTDYALRITDSSKELLEHHKRIVKNIFGYEAPIRHHSDRTKNAYILEIANVKIIRFLMRNFPELFRLSSEKEVPEKIIAATADIQRGFLRGIADAEGSASEGLKITSYSAKMIEKIRHMLCNQGIPCTISNDNSVYIQAAHAIKAFREKVGFASQRKSFNIDAIVNSFQNHEFRKQDLIPLTPLDLRVVLHEAGMLGRVHGSPSMSKKLPPSLLDLLRRKSGYCTRNTARKLVKILSQRIAGLRSVIQQADIYATRRFVSLTRNEVSAFTGLKMYQVQAIEKESLKTANSAIMAAFIKEKVSSMIEQTQENIKAIEKLLSIEVIWEKINEIESKDNPYPYLVDLQIEKYQNFIAGNIVVHNCGFIPYLYRYGFDGPIYATKPTRDIMALLQLDAVEISMKEDKELPYSSVDIKNVIEHVVPLEYHEVADISTDMRLTLYNAGHILGSSVVHLHIGDSLYNIVYTGDIKFGETRLLNPADYEFPRLETLIIESTYGGKKSIQPKRKESEEQLIGEIKKTIARGGKVLIPVFGVGRSQEVLVTLDEYRNELGEIPVYIDGMVYEATAIHTAYPEYLKRRLMTMILRGANPFLAKNFSKVDTKSRIDLAESTEPCVIVTPSGMLSVDYNEPLMVKENGRAETRKIGEVVDTLIAEKKGKPVGPHEYCIVDTEGSDLEVVGMNKNLKLEYSKVKKAIRHKVTEPLYEIVTETGRSVRCTASHSVFALRDGQIVETEVKDLCLDDYLIAPKRIPEPHAVRYVNLIEELQKLGGDITKTIAVQNVKVDGKLEREIGIDMLKGRAWEISSASRIVFTVGRRYSLPTKVKVSGELTRLLAYYVGEGSAIFTSRGAITRLSFGPGEAELAADAAECARKVFDIQTKTELLKDKHELRVTLQGGKMLAYLLKHVFRAGIGARNKRVPPLVFSFEPKLREEFIKTYLKCDGSIYQRSNRLALEFDTVSSNLASDLLYLLSSIGIVGTFSEVKKKERSIRGRVVAASKAYRVSICDGLQLRKMFTALEGKWGKFNDMLNVYERLKSPCFDRLPTNHTGLRELFSKMPKTTDDLKSLSAAVQRERMSAHRVKKALDMMQASPERFTAGEKKHLSYLRKLLEGDLGIVKITKIKRVKPSTPYVYDVSVDANESFIGGFGGLLLHNTGGPSVEYFKRMAGNEKDTILFVGYQSEGSLGRRVQKGMKEIVIIEDRKPKNIEIKINVVTVEGFSGHADRRQLLGYVKRMNPKPERILCVHGEEKKCQELARGLNKIFHVETRVPQDLDTIRLL